MAVFKLIGGFLLLCWLGFAAFLYFSQESLLYQPKPVDSLAEAELVNTLPGVDVFMVNTPDGQTLSGWYLPRKHGRGLAPALVYFGGNAEDAADFMKQAADFSNLSLVAVNYRGYGRSTGKPSQAALMADAVAVYDQAASATGGRCIVMGRSLGAGLAVHVAAERDVLGAVLVTPYDSLLAAAKENYPFMPLSLLLRDHYDMLPDAARARAPMLTLTASQDGVISPERGKALFDAWAGPDKTYVRVPSAGHNDIQTFTTYQSALVSFLKELTE